MYGPILGTYLCNTQPGAFVYTLPMSIPITLIVDDAGPLVNVFWWHVAERQQTDAPRQDSGEPILRNIPVDFLKHVAGVFGDRGLRGKFSVLPYPAGLGRISEGWSGCNLDQLQEWISIVRSEITPCMDITPEILTHAKTLDLETFALLDENERDWAAHQDVSALTRYIAAALRILNEVGLTANGVTSPWDFGVEVEEHYRRAIRSALREENGIGQAWYFLHTNPRSNEMCSKVVECDDEGWLVSICSQCKDYLWDTMESTDESPEYVSSIVDCYLTADGGTGRLRELFEAGIPIVFHSHWQSLFSNGRRTGLRALDELARRINAVWGDGVRWVKCSDLAAEIAGSSSPA